MLTRLMIISSARFLLSGPSAASRSPQRATDGARSKPHRAPDFMRYRFQGRGVWQGFGGGLGLAGAEGSPGRRNTCGHDARCVQSFYDKSAEGNLAVTVYALQSGAWRPRAQQRPSQRVRRGARNCARRADDLRTMRKTGRTANAAEIFTQEWSWRREREARATAERRTRPYPIGIQSYLFLHQSFHQRLHQVINNILYYCI